MLFEDCTVTNCNFNSIDRHNHKCSLMIPWFPHYKKASNLNETPGDNTNGIL